MSRSSNPLATYYPAFLLRCFFLLLFVSAVVFSPAGARSAAAQQRPAEAFGSYAIRDTYPDCLARARRTLDSEGYTASRVYPRSGEDIHFGAKGIHWAIILCEPPGGSRYSFHIIVASGTADVSGAYAERDKLATRMSAVDSGGGGMGGGGNANAREIPWNWSTNAAGTNVRDKIGQRFTYRCPPNGSPSGIIGTDVYEEASSICTAAVHFGLINFTNGGIVTIEVLAGQIGYRASSRNGVTSASFGSMGFGSFRFIGGPSGGDGGASVIKSTIAAEPITWNHTASTLRAQIGRQYTFSCPASAYPGTVWGTDIYTDDSSICTAAVHAGMITAQMGGTITIEIRPGANSYQASTRNGISSAQYGGWNGSFIFVRR